jgi:hypothetical protein
MNDMAYDVGYPGDGGRHLVGVDFGSPGPFGETTINDEGMEIDSEPTLTVAR